MTKIKAQIDVNFDNHDTYIPVPINDVNIAVMSVRYRYHTSFVSWSPVIPHSDTFVSRAGGKYVLFIWTPLIMIKF